MVPRFFVFNRNDAKRTRKDCRIIGLKGALITHSYSTCVSVSRTCIQAQKWFRDSINFLEYALEIHLSLQAQKTSLLKIILIAIVLITSFRNRIHRN